MCAAGSKEEVAEKVDDDDTIPAADEELTERDVERLHNPLTPQLAKSLHSLLCLQYRAVNNCIRIMKKRQLS